MDGQGVRVCSMALLFQMAMGLAEANTGGAERSRSLYTHTKTTPICIWPALFLMRRSPDCCDPSFYLQHHKTSLLVHTSKAL